MRIGICTTPEKLGQAEKMGADYIEIAVSALAAMEDAAYQALLKRLEGSPVKVEACNVLFPGHIAVVGPDVDMAAIEAYLKKALGRAAGVGAEYVVFGSGRARNIPEGADPAFGYGQLKAAMKLAGDVARGLGITIVIEPLNKGETNQINRVSEGLTLARELDHPNVRLLADFYHMRLEEEPMESIIEAGSFLRHAHIARKAGRAYPQAAGEDPYEEFFGALAKIGYEGRISIEGAAMGDEEIEGAKSLAFLRGLAESLPCEGGAKHCADA